MADWYWGSLADYYDPLLRNEAKTPSALPAFIIFFYLLITNVLANQQTTIFRAKRCKCFKFASGCIISQLAFKRPQRNSISGHKVHKFAGVLCGSLLSWDWIMHTGRGDFHREKDTTALVSKHLHKDCALAFGEHSNIHLHVRNFQHFYTQFLLQI